MTTALDIIETEANQDRGAACAAMSLHYNQAREQLGHTGLFGKALDNKARKLALKMGGITLPPGMTIAWATPEAWGKSPQGYRGPAV